MQRLSQGQISIEPFVGTIIEEIGALAWTKIRMHFSLCWIKLFHRLEKLSREWHSLHLHYITFYNSFREAMKIAQVEKVPDFFRILFWSREKISHSLGLPGDVEPLSLFPLVSSLRARLHSQGEHKEAELATACYTPSAFPPCQKFPILRTTFNLCFVVFFAIVCRSLLRMHRAKCLNRGLWEQAA